MTFFPDPRGRTFPTPPAAGHDPRTGMPLQRGSRYGSPGMAAPQSGQYGNPNVGAAVGSITGQPLALGGPLPPSAGAGSSYSVSPTGEVSATITPNLAPQAAQFAREQAELEGRQAGERQTAQFGHESKESQAARESAQAMAGLQAQNAAALARQQSDAEMALQQLRFNQGQQGFQTRLTALQGLSGGQGAVPRESYGGNIAANEGAARAAAFARAKELAGGNALGALEALKSQFADRGLMGSTGTGLEGGAIGDVIGGAAGQLGDYGREQYIQDVNRAADIADTQYSGNITQRGQDLARQQALLGLLNFNLY